MQTQRKTDFADFAVITTAVTGAFALLSVPSAQALELDWSGQFRADYNFVSHYDLSGSGNITPDSTRQNTGGYYIAPAGSNNASWGTVFMRLNPKVIVNDNVYLKSEFWVGDPIYGFWGAAYPFTSDQRQLYSSQSRGSVISAQRYWGEFLTDFGTVQVGRAPLDYGLGLFWNSGEGLWDRYESTGDLVRIISRFGAFTFSPAFVTYGTGNTLGGAAAVGTNPFTYTPSPGSGQVSDYSVMLKYENLEEDLEAGVNFVRRIAGASQDPNAGVIGPQGVPSGLAYNTWDLYLKKKVDRFSFGIETPITSGSVGGLPYSVFALAAEAKWKSSDAWETGLKLGHAPGQQNQVGNTMAGGNYTAFYFNPNYHLGTILFNLQLANLGQLGTQNNPNTGAQNLNSPYDAPITNANYIALEEDLHAEKWTFDTGLIYAHAVQTAAQGTYFYNQWTHTLSPTAAVSDQSGSLGTEWDLGAQFQWDEHFLFRWDMGLFFPGAFYKFSNAANGAQNDTSTVFASIFRLGVNF